MKRILYSLRQYRRYKASLKALCHHPQACYPRATDIHPDDLKKQGIAVLILDFDGVLASHGEPAPCQAVLPWLEQCVNVFGAHGVFILSNKPNLTRRQYFAKHFPTIRFIRAARKKPYPDGLQRVLLESGIAPEKLAIVDDRLLTGLLAACIAGVRGIYITAPYVQYTKRPLVELFFKFLRWFERRLIL